MEISGSEPRSLGLLCGLFGYTRQAYYGQFRETEKDAASAYMVISEVSRIRKVQKRIGGRKLHHMLRSFMEEHSVMMGRDGFFDLLRDHSLLVRKKRLRKPRTTYSGSWMKRHPNLAKEFIPVAANQLWVSDITYIRVGDGFAAALRMAFVGNPETRGLIHHSDRGLQYYSTGYMKLLKGRAVRVSMSEKSDPLENAIAERVNGILKDELLEKRFDSFSQAQCKVTEAVSTYNNLRPHLSIGMLTPAEAHTKQGSLKRLWKSTSWGKRPPFTLQASA